MKIGLLSFPKSPSVHDHTQILAGECVLILDNEPRHDIDLYLCSVHFSGWKEFKKFSIVVGRQNVIAMGSVATSSPNETYRYAWKVVAGQRSNFDEIIVGPPGIV